MDKYTNRLQEDYIFLITEGMLYSCTVLVNKIHTAAIFINGAAG